MITLNNILGRMTIDYDSIIFWYRGDSFTYIYVIENFDLDHVFLYNMWLDPFDVINIDFIS